MNKKKVLAPLVIVTVFVVSFAVTFFISENIRESMLSRITLEDIQSGNAEPIFMEAKDCDKDPTDELCTAVLADEQSKTPYVPATSTNPVQIFSATSTPIVVAGFSFMLPQGWEGEVNSNDIGFNISMHKIGVPSAFLSIECPPSGKGFEGSVAISHVTRSQVLGKSAYVLELEERAYQGRNHWYSLSIGLNPATALRPSCWGQGNVTPETTEAIQMFFETFDLAGS